MPIVPVLLLVGLIAGGAYALSQSSDGGDAKKKAGPKKASDYLPPPSPKVEAVKAKIRDLQRKAEQGDRNAGKLIDDLRKTWGDLSK
jgi:hypothetical protein